MVNPDDLASMTVVELRKFAKENGISLGGAVTKAAIHQRITEKLQEELEARLAEAGGAEVKTKPVRRAVIISDDGEDAPQGTAAGPRLTPAAKPETRGTQGGGKNKPVFTLQGARAWHNPQPFAPQGGGKAGPAGGPVNPLQFGQPRRPVLRPAARFGPQAAAPTAQEDAEARPPAYPPPLVPRPIPPASAFPQSPYQIPDAFRPPVSGDADRSLKERTVPDLQAPYHHPALQDLPPEQASQPAVPRVREAGAALGREGGLNPAIPDMLATGDCGDGAGVLEIHPDGYGFLRAGNYLLGKNDVYISNAQIRRFHLRSGDHVEGKTRPQRDSDRYAAMLYITRINGEDAEDVRERVNFDELTPTYPNRQIRLSSKKVNDTVLRLIDMFAPIGFGQRAMIVAAPKAGKTTILKKIALAIRQGHPDIHLMMLLVDERPEEVTDLKETVGGDILYSTFDEPAENHIRVSELVLERAMRLVEKGSDVVVLMDSLTRLSRAYNTLAPSTARVMSGGLAAGVLNKPKRFFGAARNLKEGGSLTVIATALIETGSRMDDVIFEEFKGTGNMELTLDRQLSEMRVFPAVSIARSGTRHDELLLSPEEIAVAQKIRAMISGSSEQEGMSLILSMMEKTKDNADFVTRYDDWMALMRNSSYTQPGRQY